MSNSLLSVNCDSEKSQALNIYKQIVCEKLPHFLLTGLINLSL